MATKRPLSRSSSASKRSRHEVPVDRAESLEHLTLKRGKERYLLRLYITGLTPASRRAVEHARALCEEHLHGRYELEVFDIYQMPALAKDHQIIAAPTLIKVLPAPLRRFVGDLSRSERVLFGLDVRPRT